MCAQGILLVHQNEGIGVGVLQLSESVIDIAVMAFIGKLCILM